MSQIWLKCNKVDGVVKTTVNTYTILTYLFQVDYNKVDGVAKTTVNTYTACIMGRKPFYSHAKGYKMHLTVYAKGKGRETGHCVFVYATSVQI